MSGSPLMFLLGLLLRSWVFNPRGKDIIEENFKNRFDFEVVN